MELTKPSTLTFSQELMLTMKAKQEKEEKHSILYDNVAIPEVHIHKKEK